MRSFNAPSEGSGRVSCQRGGCRDRALPVAIGRVPRKGKVGVHRKVLGVPGAELSLKIQQLSLEAKVRKDDGSAPPHEVEAVQEGPTVVLH